MLKDDASLQGRIPAWYPTLASILPVKQFLLIDIAEEESPVAMAYRMHEIMLGHASRTSSRWMRGSSQGSIHQRLMISVRAAGLF